MNSPSTSIKFIYHGISSLDQFIYRKKNNLNQYFIFENNQFDVESVGGNTAAIVYLNLEDGGIGDFDGEVNGIIYDPGGPALVNNNLNIPVWDWWHLILTGSLLAFIFYFISIRS